VRRNKSLCTIKHALRSAKPKTRSSLVKQVLIWLCRRTFLKYLVLDNSFAFINNGNVWSVSWYLSTRFCYSIKSLIADRRDENFRVNLISYISRKSSKTVWSFFLVSVLFFFWILHVFFVLDCWLSVDLLPFRHEHEANAIRRMERIDKAIRHLLPTNYLTCSL